MGAAPPFFVVFHLGHLGLALGLLDARLRDSPQVGLGEAPPVSWVPPLLPADLLRALTYGGEEEIQ